MNHLLLYFLLLLNLPLSAQVATSEEAEKRTAFAAFEPLLQRSWQADEQWDNGQRFTQTVYFTTDLEGQIIRAETTGYTDQAQTQWGARNHGIRRWNPDHKRLEFFEFDALGQLTTGHLTIEYDSIFYHYRYGGNELTDAWIPIDANTYQFIVGIRTDGQWQQIFLHTTFKALMTNPTPPTPTTPLPYREIPVAPDTYNACTVAARMIDGLGFRYYWATEGLRPEDLAYRPGPEARTMAETIEHIHGLTETVHHTVARQPIIRGVEKPTLTFTEQRRETLSMLKTASDILRNSHPDEMENFQLIFQRGERRSEYPFWNNLNGPLADALWHVGQVVLLRRAAGNPFNSKVSVFQGKLRE